MLPEDLDLQSLIDVEIPRVYHALDERRSIFDIWSHVNHHAAALSFELRGARSSSRTATELVDVVMWFFTYCGRVQPSAPGWVHESEVEGLIRLRSRYSDELWQHWRTDELHTRPSGFADWRRTYARLFERTFGLERAPSLMLLLFESLGFVSDAMSRFAVYVGEFTPEAARGHQAQFASALADAGGHLLALTHLVCGESFERELLAKYSDGIGGIGCRKCHSAPCSCQLLFVPIDVASVAVVQAQGRDAQPEVVAEQAS